MVCLSFAYENPFWRLFENGGAIIPIANHRLYARLIDLHRSQVLAKIVIIAENSPWLSSYDDACGIATGTPL